MQIKLVILTICASLVAIGFAAPAPQDGQSLSDPSLSGDEVALAPPLSGDEVAPSAFDAGGPNPPADEGIDEGVGSAFLDEFDGIGENLLRKRQFRLSRGRAFRRKARKYRAH
ncbi:hypothetical protein RMATCC62417_17579 [Rhizopus microsporus]|nr:hypothetical protein RMATCC62417_17579 [Rhizopus microsporus]